MIVFTICSRNFLAQAQVLYNSLRLHHDDLVFFVGICDSCDLIDVNAFPFSIVPMTDLGIPDLDQMMHRYNITELNTAIKPFVFSYLFDAFPNVPVIYLDPDILVVSPLDELRAELSAGADCVLTPHMTEPQEFAEMHEGRMLSYGIYNLGFCALRGTPEVRRIVEWWGRRLETQCVIDLPSGLFVDQKWADLFPAFIERTKILKHPGYNVAYWNLARRTVRRTDDGWLVNGSPLRFFHFSGSVIDEPIIFSRHSSQFRLEALSDLRGLFDQYIDLVRHFGRDYYRRMPYAFSWDGQSGQNLHTPSSDAPDEATDPQPSEQGLSVEVAPPHLPLLRARSLKEYEAALAGAKEILNRRQELEMDLVPLTGDQVFSSPGECVVCGARELLQTSFMYASGHYANGRPKPNWREHMQCPHCRFVNRLRACLHILFQELRPQRDATIYITEQVTPLYAWLKARFPNLVGSEYMGPDQRPGQQVGDVRHEDIERLSFATGSFDLILSFDVLEHVPNEKRALQELSRCLRPGGQLLFTAPFDDRRAEHEARAILQENGSIEHLLPPEYHGNPVDAENGALCYRYFGWRLMDDLREAGLSDPEGWFYWSNQYGYLGDTSSVFFARR